MPGLDWANFDQLGADHGGHDGVAPGAWSFYLLRVLLGIAEAGFFPGIILYLTYWFPARERARAVSLFMTGSPITSIVGAPLSGGILQYLDRVGGLRGWQWLFLQEGDPRNRSGRDQHMLPHGSARKSGTALERMRRNAIWPTAQVSGEETSRQQRHGLTLSQAATDRRVWILTLLYFTVAGPATVWASICRSSFKSVFRIWPNFGSACSSPSRASVPFRAWFSTACTRTGPARRGARRDPGFGGGSGVGPGGLG